VLFANFILLLPATARWLSKKLPIFLMGFLGSAKLAIDVALGVLE